jgi:hypothetical protein
MAVWLDRINYYRMLAHVPAVLEDTNLSAGDLAAASYVVRVGPPLTHNEDPLTPYYEDTNTIPITPTTQYPNPYYSVAGQTAAEQSDLFAYPYPLPPQGQSVDGWMSGAFHGPNMLDPRLQTVGFNTFQDLNSTSGFRAAAALNIEGGLDQNATGFPVYWPGSDSTVSLTTYDVNEEPDARTSCAGYANTTPGLPISLQLGPGNVATPGNPAVTGVSQYSLTLNNSIGIPCCEIDETNYTNQSYPSWQSWGRNVLQGQGTVVLLPQQPLATGSYTASITVNRQIYSWSFTIGTAVVPTVTGLSQSSGSVAGGTIVTINGTGFTGATAVNFGSTAASDFTVNSDTQITAICPAVTSPRVVDVTVTAPGGTSAPSTPVQFSYIDTLNFFCIDTSGRLSYAAYSASGGSWPLSFSQVSTLKSTDCTALQFTEVAGAMVGTNLHILGIDNTSGALWHAICAASGPLSFEQVSAQSPGGKAYQKVSCAGTPSGSVHVCVVDASGIAYHDVHTATQGNWQLSFGDNINLLCGGTSSTFNDIACTAIGEVLHIVAGGFIPPAPVTLIYTYSSTSQTGTFRLNPYIDIYRTILNYTGPGIVPEPIERGIGLAAIGGVLHVYFITTGGQIPFDIAHTASSDGGHTWQAVDAFSRALNDRNFDLSCITWGGNVHIGYGFPWVPGIFGIRPTTQTLEHTIYSSSGWSSGYDTALTQDKEGNYFTKICIVGGENCQG